MAAPHQAARPGTGDRSVVVKARTIACPTCKVTAGAPCVDGGRALPYVHPDRLTAWATTTIQAAAGKLVEPVRAYRGRWRDLPKPAAEAPSKRKVPC